MGAGRGGKADAGESGFRARAIDAGSAVRVGEKKGRAAVDCGASCGGGWSVLANSSGRSGRGL